MAVHTRVDSCVVDEADELLDEVWLNGGDVERALALARRMSAEVGRDPAIEDAKVLVAGIKRCTPSQAFDHLVSISQHTNTKVAVVARRIVALAGDGEVPRR